MHRCRELIHSWKFPITRGYFHNLRMWSLECLLVAENETLSNGIVNTWNKKKSIALLRFYGEADDTDNEDETSSRLTSSLRLAKKLGMQHVQLNFAMLTL